MMNEIFFVFFVLIDLFLALIILKIFGKTGIVAFYVLHIIMSQVTIKMQIDIFGVTAIFGSILYGILFLAMDLINEHYGRKEAHNTVNIGIISLMVFIFIVQAAFLFSPSKTNEVSSSFNNLFSNQWRAVIADLIVSYFAMQQFGAWFYNKIRVWSKNRFLWMRSNISTWTTQILTAVLFFNIAFYGILPNKLIWSIIFGGLLMKLSIALLETPFLYLSYRFLPKKK